MNYNDFEKIVVEARARRDVYNDVGFWDCIKAVGFYTVRSHFFNADRDDVDDIVSDIAERLVRFRQHTVKNTRTDILMTYPVRHLWNTVNKIAVRAMCDFLRKTYSRRENETSETDMNARDGELDFEENYLDERENVERTSATRGLFELALSVGDVAGLIIALGIKKHEFSDEGNKTQKEAFVRTVMKHLSPYIQKGEAYEWATRIEAVAPESIDRFYYKLYNDKKAKKPVSKIVEDYTLGM